MTTPFSPPFPPASYADWLARVQEDLKDSTVYESLRWQSPEGFTVEPYYTAEHLESGSFAGEALQSQQSVQKSALGWLNAPAYTALPGEEKNQNAALRDALSNGAEALVLTLADAVSLARLLDGIKLSNTPIFFRLGAGVEASRLLQIVRQIAPYQLRGGILTLSGALPPAVLTDLLEQSSESPNFRTIGIDGQDFHNAGATATQELGFTLARLAETYEQLTGAGLTVDQLVPKTMLSVSVGTSYFMEMAKLRALRVLLARLLPTTTSQPILLHCQTSTFYEATATPYTNLLRATTEAMAAVIGGTDVLTVRPYDAVLAESTAAASTVDAATVGTSTEFSERIARNVSTLLKAESYLDKVADQAAGSYYIENLTHQLTEAAWALFQQVQQLGGLSGTLDSGYIQQEIDRAYQGKIAAVESGRVLVGVTKFRHDEAGASKPMQTEGDLTELKNRRLAASFE